MNGSGGGIGGKILHWLDRFGWAELAGLATSYLGYHLIASTGAGGVVAAFGAAIGENVGYYTVIFLRDLRALPAGERHPRRVARAMLHDFGIAEGLDTLILRPGLTWGAVALLGPVWGIAAGKFLCDLAFYGIAITFYERRRAREGRR